MFEMHSISTIVFYSMLKQFCIVNIPESEAESGAS